MSRVSILLVLAVPHVLEILGNWTSQLLLPSLKMVSEISNIVSIIEAKFCVILAIVLLMTLR